MNIIVLIRHAFYIILFKTADLDFNNAEDAKIDIKV